MLDFKDLIGYRSLWAHGGWIADDLFLKLLLKKHVDVRLHLLPAAFSTPVSLINFFPPTLFWRLLDDLMFRYPASLRAVLSQEPHWGFERRVHSLVGGLTNWRGWGGPVPVRLWKQSGQKITYVLSWTVVWSKKCGKCLQQQQQVEKTMWIKN